MYRLRVNLNHLGEVNNTHPLVGGSDVKIFAHISYCINPLGTLSITHFTPFYNNNGAINV